jgi:phosphatidylserine/phosphatidylglycerophosphate/cardiolipin synthase-like enzyme
MRVATVLVAALLAGCSAAPLEEGSSSSQRASAPAWALDVLASGTWTETDAVRAWVDVKVANVRYHKRVLVEVYAPYENGQVLRTILPAWYKASEGSAERWGTDAIELYPTGGPNGSKLAGPVMVRARMQHDLDRDGRDEMITTAWRPLFGEGRVEPKDDPWEPGLTSPVRATGKSFEALFTPFDDAGARVVKEIDEVIAAKAADPTGRHTIHAAIFNINDARITGALARAHRAGVEVRLVTEATKFRPAATWQTGDDQLVAAGVPLLGVRRPGRGAMHDKIAIFDGKKVATGSFNWEPNASVENHENMVVSDDPALVAAYARRFEMLAGDVQSEHRIDRGAPAYASFGPDEEPHRLVGDLIDGAKKSLHVAMFTAKDVHYDGTSLLEKLIAAHQRGVEVILLTDYGICEAAEYFGRISDDDQTDEWVESFGIKVVRVEPPFGRYASMHHKMMVVDGETVVTGALNWYYDAAFLNDEDVLVAKDAALASRFTGEIVDLLRRYDPAFDASKWPSANLQLVVPKRDTQWGEEVVLFWDQNGWQSPIPLTGWPEWKTTLTAPMGIRAEYKLAIRGPHGLRWENGANRLLTVRDESLRLTYR